MKRPSIPYYHPADPACPWTEDYNPETIMEAYEDAADAEIDMRMEEER
jgi:hypothetical protein